MPASIQPPPAELPCGYDCQFHLPLPECDWVDWGWCTHPAHSGLRRTGRDCRWFRVRSAGPLPELPAKPDLPGQP